MVWLRKTLAIIACTYITHLRAFRLPGVAPKEYLEGGAVDLKEKLESKLDSKRKDIQTLEDEAEKLAEKLDKKRNEIERLTDYVRKLELKLGGKAGGGVDPRKEKSKSPDDAKEQATYAKSLESQPNEGIRVLNEQNVQRKDYLRKVATQ